MPEKHFYEQKEYANRYLIPYFRKHIPDFEKKKVLEVGCAEAGLLDALSELGMETVGIELSEMRASVAKSKNKNLRVHVGDISKKNAAEKIGETFDMIVMREVIEHIPDKKTTFENLDKLLRPGGYLFMSFPPKYSAFAGHQQVGKTMLKAFPYIHMLPKPVIKMMMDLVNEPNGFLDHVKMNYGTGCSISVFENLYKSRKFVPVVKEFYVFRPIYKLRFDLPTIKFPNIPVFREFVAFGCETLLKKG